MTATYGHPVVGREATPYEPPNKLWSRLKFGREEFLQRLMTSLILGGHQPPWNQRSVPTDRGFAFLRGLDQLSFGEARSDGPNWFVDECCLAAVDEGRANGWPDWAVLWSDRVWVVELKTERGSHRPDQLPYYFELAAAAIPGADVDLTYLTGPLDKLPPELAPGHRFAHLTWSDIVELVRECWTGDPAPGAAAYVEIILDGISRLDLRPSEWRSEVIGVTAESHQAASHDELLDLARSTAKDGRQRAIGATSPEELTRMRDAARETLEGLPSDDPTRSARPWQWRAATTDGRALTPEGAEFGYELRFSRYR